MGRVQELRPWRYHDRFDDRPHHQSGSPRTAVYLKTFGCQMNELDSELVRGHLKALGYQFTDSRDQAEVIYSTRSVREQVENKVWSRLGQLGQEKEAGRRVIVGVMGCMAEREGVGLDEADGCLRST